ncbi:MAG: Uma2 family endonuclease [Fibrella sp.]|nr:Uma2 family endonuclease [Armatimonadota bacterium]
MQVMEPGSQIVLRDISFDTYRCLLDNYTDQNTPRLTYDRGTLEIMSPLTRRHEEANRTLAKIVETILDVWERDYVNIGSMTFQRADVSGGFEPDTGFYVANYASVVGKDEIDLAGGDPAPDSIIEVDVTSPSLPRFPIYAAFGVGEIWQCIGGVVTVAIRTDDSYRPVEESATLPGVTPTLLTDWLAASKTTRRALWVGALRGWASGNSPDGLAQA